MALLFPLLHAKLHAAAITWNTPVNIYNDSDISTFGTLLYAEDWSAAATVNGISFTYDSSSTGDSNVALTFPTPAGASSSAVGGGTSQPYEGISTNYKRLVRGLAYSANGAAGATVSGTITLQGLTPGNAYQVQIWINDSRAGGTSDSTPTRVTSLTSTGGNSVTLANYVGGTSTSPIGGLGQYAIGTFLADSTKQPILISASNKTSTGTESVQVNAIQVASISISGTAAVQYSSTQQRIDGFGASSAWISSWSVQQADLFFSTNPNGVGLSLLRSRIAPDGSSVETGIMQMAQARGATVWSTPWSPPASDKDSGTVNGGNFVSSPANYTSYAAQLAGYVATMQNTYGINIHTLSVQNEPTDNETTYESCVWTAQQIHDFIPYLSTALYNSGVSSTAIMLPEEQDWDFSLATTTMSDLTTSGAVGVLAAHDYQNTEPTAPLTQFGSPAPVPVWETEHYFGSDDSIQNGLALAQEIHTFLTVVNANAYHYWWLYGSGNGSLAGNSTDTPAKRLYVMGNYSKFVRPGFYRVTATNSTAALVSVYKDPASSNYVIVAANPTQWPITQTFDLTSCPSATTLNQWITSATLSLASQPAVTVTGGKFTYALPAYSVVTFTTAPAPTPLIVLNTSDNSGASSWNAIGNWDDTTAPNAASNYNAAQYTLRTPAQSGSFTFSGNSLTLPLLGCLSFEGSNGASITVPSLTLAGGTVRNDTTGTAFTLAGAINVAAPSIISLGSDSTRSINISATLSGTGTLNVGNGGPGTVSCSGNNTAFTGALQVTGATTLQVGSQSNLGGNPSSLNPAQLTLNNATLQPTASFTMSNANSGVTFASGGAVINLNAGYSLTITNPVTGPGGLTVYGPGVLALNGVNTFTGPITVAGSTLHVSGLASQGPITIISATLSGTGAIAGSTSVYGILMPSPAGFTFSSTLNLQSSALLVTPLMTNSTSAIAPVTAAAANISSGATVNIALNSAGSAVDFSNPFWSATHTWPLLTSPALTGTLTMGTVSADTAGRSAAWFGAFALQQTGTAANLVWTPAAPWQQWQAIHFGANWSNSAVAGPNVITSPDGMPNLLKYALALDPAVTYPPSTHLATTLNTNGYLQLTVTKNPAATDVTLTIQASNDITNPANWTSSATTIDQNTPTLLQAHDTTPISAAPAAFLRLKVTQP